MLQHFGEQVFVQHRFAEKPRARVYPPSADGLFIELNYSGLRATLKQEGSVYNQPDVLLFPQAMGTGMLFTPTKQKGSVCSDGRVRSSTQASSSPRASSSASPPARASPSRASSSSCARMPMEVAFAPPPPRSATIRKRRIGQQKSTLAIKDVCST